MNDLNTRACCHISDKIGRNEKQERLCSCFMGFFYFAVGISSRPV
jgi:hypothetical protein